MARVVQPDGGVGSALTYSLTRMTIIHDPSGIESIEALIAVVPTIDWVMSTKLPLVTATGWPGSSGSTPGHVPSATDDVFDTWYAILDDLADTPVRQ